MKLIKVLAHSFADYVELSNEFTTQLMERTGYHRGLYRTMQVLGVPLKNEDIEKLSEASEKGTRLILRYMNFTLRTVIDHGHLPSEEETKAFQESPACHYCGAEEWDFDEDRRTTCCQSL